MHHEGDAAVEIVKPARFGQGLLPGMFGKIACQLKPRDAQEIEILPVEPACEWRPGKNDQSEKAIEMMQRNNRPGAWFGQKPIRHGQLQRCLIATQHWLRLAQSVEIDDKAPGPVSLERPYRCRRHRQGGYLCRGPLPAARKRQTVVLGLDEQQASRTACHIGQHPDHTLVQ